jgi:hypothetical protein
MDKTASGRRITNVLLRDDHERTESALELCDAIERGVDYPKLWVMANRLRKSVLA